VTGAKGDGGLTAEEARALLLLVQANGIDRNTVQVRPPGVGRTHMNAFVRAGILTAAKGGRLTPLGVTVAWDVWMR